MEKIFKKTIIEKLSNISELNVAIHNGLFHADDVFSIILLRQLAKVCGFKLNVIRTRDPKKLAEADMRVDVGGKWDEATMNFDHHQKDPKLMQPEGVKHAAFGLVCKWCMTPEFLNEFRPRYVLGIEYVDNGGKKNEYPSIGVVVPAFNPAYGEEEDFDRHFEMAVEALEPVLLRAIENVKGCIRAEAEFESKKLESLEGGKIIVFPHFIPVDTTKHPEVMFTIFPQNGGYVFKGYCGAVVKEAFRGLRGDELFEKTGYEGVFTHVTGFTGIMQTLEGAKALCLQSI